MVGSFVALTATHRIRRADGDFSRSNAAAVGIALGGAAVWASHFIGLMALKLDVAVSYSVVDTLLSLVLSIGGSVFALGYVARAPEQRDRLLRAGAGLGLGFVALHHLGMHGL